MKISILLAITFLAVSGAMADAGASKLYAALEHRLQSIKSLEIQYEVTGAAADNQAVKGTMIWSRPDHFYHDTPEWTLCETGDEQWRFLKQQNTLIREAAEQQDEFRPDNLLFNMTRSFRATTLATQGDHRVLNLESSDAGQPGSASIEFPGNSDVPDAIQFQQPDNTPVRYRIVSWDENVRPDPALFIPPVVPPENTIDFRAAGAGK